jgi:DNA-binding transcriptional regulator YhcF (GntR family)
MLYNRDEFCLLFYKGVVTFYNIYVKGASLDDLDKGKSLLMTAVTNQTLPKYVSISEDLRRQIVNGHLQPGARLEAQPKLAESYGVSLLTARQALGKLEAEGFIEQRRGHGTFVVKNVNTPSELQLNNSQSVGLMFVQNTGHSAKTNSYYVTLIREIGDVVSSADYDLKVAMVTDAAFKPRQPHGMLGRRRLRALVVDGYVSQLHVDVIRDLGIDVLLAGVHPVSDDVPRVCHNVRQAVYEISKAMIALDHGPVILFTEPYRYHYTIEMLLGYQQAMYESAQCPITFSAQADAIESWEQIMDVIVRQHRDRFCVMSMLRVTDAILERCKTLPLDVSRIPTCIVGNPYIDHKELQSSVIACEMSANEIGRGVGESLVTALRNRKPIQSCVFEPVIQSSAMTGSVWPIRCEWQRRPQ